MKAVRACPNAEIRAGIVASTQLILAVGFFGFAWVPLKGRMSGYDHTKKQTMNPSQTSLEPIPTQYLPAVRTAPLKPRRSKTGLHQRKTMRRPADIIGTSIMQAIVGCNTWQTPVSRFNPPNSAAWNRS